jgi:hypothetical protein
VVRGSNPLAGFNRVYIKSLKNPVVTPKRSKIQREADLEKIAEMYLQGYKQADIAAQLDVQFTSNNLQ